MARPVCVVTSGGVPFVAVADGPPATPVADGPPIALVESGAPPICLVNDDGSALAEETAENLADVGADINTTDKTLGKLVLDTTNLEVLSASGTNAEDAWTNWSGGSDIEPA